MNRKYWIDIWGVHLLYLRIKDVSIKEGIIEYVLYPFYRGKESVRFAPSPFNRVVAFCCGGWFDKSKSEYVFLSRQGLLHFCFLSNQLSQIQAVRMLYQFSFEDIMGRNRDWNQVEY